MSSPLSKSSTDPEAASPTPLQVAAWTESLLSHLADAGDDGGQTVEYIRMNKVSIGFRKQKATGAMWLPGGRIYLNADTYSLASAPGDSFMLSLVAHETLHLRQGIFKALSVLGELEAWQLGFRVFMDLGGQVFHPSLIELMGLTLSYDREMLKKARSLMQAYAGTSYRADLLPLYPLPKEIAYAFTRQVPVYNNP